MVGTPNYPKSFGDAFTELKTNLAATRTAANTRQAMSVVKAATMSFLGDLVIEAGGRFIARYTPERAAMVVGRDADPASSLQGIWMYRPGGEPLFMNWGDGLGNGYWALLDKNQRIVLSDDGVTGYGMAEPKLNYPLPIRADPSAVTTTWGQTATTSFETIGRCYATITHPRIHMLTATTADSGVSGEFILSVNGTQASTTATGSINEIMTVPGWGVSIKPGAHAHIEYRARVTGGTGKVYGAVQGLRGVGSA